MTATLSRCVTIAKAGFVSVDERALVPAQPLFKNRPEKWRFVNDVAVPARAWLFEEPVQPFEAPFGDPGRRAVERAAFVVDRPAQGQPEFHARHPVAIFEDELLLASAPETDEADRGPRGIDRIDHTVDFPRTG